MSNSVYGYASTRVTRATRYRSFDECDSAVAGEIEYKRQRDTTLANVSQKMGTFRGLVPTDQKIARGASGDLPAMPALEVLDTLPFAEGKNINNMAAVLRHMEAYCSSKTNVIYERYQLSQRAQKQGEPFDDYLISLRSMNRACNYGATQDELLRDKIAHGIRNNDTRQKLLQEAKLTLATAISICRAAESISAQAKVISFCDDVHALTAYSTRNKRRQSTVTARVSQTCQYCG